MLTRIRSREALPVLLLLAGLLGALLLAGCSGADVASDSPDGGSGAPVAEGDAAGVGDDSSANNVETGGGLGSLNGRKIVRNATIDLRVEDVQQSVVDVQGIATRAGGFVSESRLFVAPGSDDDEASRTQNASIVIRVPAEEFDDSMNQLRGVADEVESETANASEVTEEFTDLEARLRNLEATEQQYLAFLERAESIEEVLAVQDRLDGVRLEIEQAQGRLNVLADLTDLATITVELAPVGAPTGGGSGNWAVEALETAWEVSLDAMVVLGTAAIAAAALLVWLAVLSAVLIPAWRLFGRRAVSLAKRLYEL